MKQIAVRLNKTFEYELHFTVSDNASDEYIYQLASSLEGANLELMNKTSLDADCRMIAEYNDLVNWDVVE